MGLRPQVFVSILTIALLTCIFPSVRAQTTTITDISYPRESAFNLESRTASPPLTVSATVGFLDAKVGDLLAVGVFDLESGRVESGSGSASPAECVPRYLYAGCLVVITSSAGTENITFQLTSPRRIMQLTLVAGIYGNDSSTLIPGSTSDVEFAIRVATAVSLELNVPNAVTVLVDGKEQGQGSVSVSLVVGNHNLSIPDIVQLNDGTRIKFEKWSDGVTQENRTVQLKQGITLEAIYQTQHFLTLISPQVNITGMGWYNEGSVANISAPPGILPMNGLLGILRGNWKFQGWYDGQTLLSHATTAQISMSKPHTLEARWYGDYTMPLIWTAVFSLAFGACVVIVQSRLIVNERGRRTKKRGTRRRRT
jgi:hypothetical protein